MHWEEGGDEFKFFLFIIPENVIIYQTCFPFFFVQHGLTDYEL